MSMPWLKSRASKLEAIGYVFCPKTRWWWCESRKCAVDDRTIKTEYKKFINHHLIMCTIHDYVFYSAFIQNCDILDTIYRNKFPLKGFKSNRKKIDDDMEGI